MLHIIFNLLNVLASFLEGMSDARKKLRGGVIKHQLSALIRCAAWGSAVFTIYMIENVDRYERISYFMIFALEYWIVFDPTYNRFAGQSWWSTGDNSGMDGILPGYENRWKRLALKCSLLCMSIVAYICL